MSWVLTTIAAILAILIGSETKYSRAAALLVMVGMLATLLYFFAGLYSGWIQAFPEQH